MKNSNIINYLLFLLIIFTNFIFIIFVSRYDLIHSILSQILLVFLFFWYLNYNLRKFSNKYVFLILLIFYIKLILIYFIIVLYWIPILELNIGYDPIRYWIQSDNLISQNFQTYWISLNYSGILFYYAFIKKFLGNSVFVVALTNAILATIAIVELLKIISSHYKNFLNNKYFKYLLFIILVPEVVFYEAISSRESIVSTLYLFIFIFFYKLFFEKKNIGINFSFFIILIFLITTIRGIMVIPIILSVITVIFINAKTISFKKILLIFISTVILTVSADYIIKLVGGNSTSIINLFISSFDKSLNVASYGNFQFSGDSISNIIMPNNLLEALIFLPIRTIMYLVSPFPNYTPFIINLINGDFQQFQNLFAILTSILNIILFPYLLMGMIYYFFLEKNYYKIQTIFIFYIYLIIAISGGNLILHDRYRAMSSILFIICSFLGFNIKDKLHLSKKFIYIGWWFIISSIVLLYFILKIV